MFCFYLFSFYLFFSSSLCVLTVSIFLYFFTACKHTGWLCFLFACHFAVTLCNNTLHLLQLDRFIKTNPYMDFLCYLYIFHVNFLGEAYIFLTLDLPQLNQNVSTFKSLISEQYPCYNVLLWTSFCFLQVNQQKRVEMFSTNTIMYFEQMYKP